jgi:hypothetical protein
MVNITKDRRFRLDVGFVEQGDIYFFYKLRKAVEKPRGIQDVARFFFVLDPYGEIPPRYIVMGNKKMPAFTDGGETAWGFVQMVGGRGFETYRGSKKSKKGMSRPTGEGIYAVVTHRDHSHLLYSLELPSRLGEVQKAFQIKREGNYIFLERSIEVPPKNPDEPFSNFSPVTGDRNLNLRGTELLLVGVGADIGRLGVRVEKSKETLETSDIINELKVDTKNHPTASLISGKWE